MHLLPEALVELAESRHGVLRREDLERAGVGRRRRDGLVRRRALERAGRGVYRVIGAPRTWHQQVVIACLDAGGVATHSTAAALHGLRGFDRAGPIEVMVHEARNCRSPLARLRTNSTIEAEDVTVVDGIPTTTVARTLLSLGSIAGLLKHGKEISEWVVEDTFDEVLATGRATQAEIERMLARCRRSGRGGVRLVERMLRQREGGQITESHLERAALAVLEVAGVPLPRCQARIAAAGAFVARVDFLYEAQGAVIEVSGHRWHRSVEQMERDTTRRRELTDLGLRVYEFTYRQVANQPHLLVATARRILAGGDRRSRDGPLAA